MRRAVPPAELLLLQYVPPVVLADRIEVQPDGCWWWTGYVRPPDSGKRDAGYGHVKYRGGRYLAHRLVYELCVGPIPPTRVLDHTCHRAGECTAGPACMHRRCVNPAHLEPVTVAENNRRSNPRNGGGYPGRTSDGRRRMAPGGQPCEEHPEIITGPQGGCIECHRARARARDKRRMQDPVLRARKAERDRHRRGRSGKTRRGPVPY